MQGIVLERGDLPNCLPDRLAGQQHQRAQQAQQAQQAQRAPQHELYVDRWSTISKCHRASLKTAGDQRRHPRGSSGRKSAGTRAGLARDCPHLNTRKAQWRDPFSACTDP